MPEPNKPLLTATDVIDIVLGSSGLRPQVAPEKSVFKRSKTRGVRTVLVGRLCRTCETRVCGDEADHRDLVLTEEERNAQESVVVCVSRSKTHTLELEP